MALTIMALPSQMYLLTLFPPCLMFDLQLSDILPLSVKCDLWVGDRAGMEKRNSECYLPHNQY